MSETRQAGRPAILGGDPLFSPALAFTRPAVPDYAELEPEFRNIVESGMLTKGPYLGQLEQALKAYIGAEHVVCVHSCTSGLLLGIQSLKLDGEVIVPSFSFPATFHALRWNNLTPIFVDCEPDTLTVDVAAVEAAITPRTCAVMSAYLFGNPPDLKALDELCQSRGLAHFCDSAHGMGTYYLGRPAGNRCDFEVFSASPTKLLTAAEGGIVATRHARVAEWLRVGRDYGNPGDYDCRFPGLNARMSEFHACLALKGLPHLADYVATRARLIDLYKQILGDCPGVRFQTIRAGCTTSHKDFPILIRSEHFGLSRDQLQAALAAEGIPTRAYFNPPGHRQTPYRIDIQLPVTDLISAEILCLPVSTRMEAQDAERIGHAILDIQRCAREICDRLGSDAR